MSDKYPHLTSYNYCANNPVMLVDPDGRDVIIAGEDGSQYNYGKDPKYEGSDKFILKAVSAINKIASRKEGKSMINELVNSKNVFNVEEGQESKFEASNQLKAFAKKISEDNPNFPTSLLEGGSGGTIKWNTNGVELPTEGGLGKDATMDLAHELSHGLDANRGMLNDSKFDNTYKYEWQAVYRENLIRSEQRLPLRTGYGVTRYPNGEINDISTRMLKDGKNVRPIWYK